MLNHYAVTPEMPDNTRHYELAQFLQELGWSATIFATPFNHKEKRFVRPVAPWRLSVECDEGGVRFTWLYTLPYRRNNWRRFANMMSYLATSLGRGMTAGTKPDVVLGSSPHLLAALGAWLLARRFRVPFVFEVRDLWPESLVDMGTTNPAIIWPLAMIDRQLCRKADHVIALSSGIETALLQKGVARDRVTLIPSAARTAAHLTAEERARQREHLGWGDEYVFIYAGAHGPANDLSTVVEAARLLEHRAEIRFALVGDGSEKSALQARAAGLRNIEFLSPVPKDEIHTVLQAADCGLITLRRSKVFDGVRPAKLYDYVGVGLPIVSNVNGEVLKLIREGDVGLVVEPENPPALAGAVAAMAEDAEMRVRFSINAKRYGMALPSREQTADLLSKVLDAQIAETQSAWDSRTNQVAEVVKT